MGMSVYTKMIVGALVEEGEVFISREKVPSRCGACEAAYAQGLRFCGACGYRLLPVKCLFLQPSLLAYLSKQPRPYFKEGEEVTPGDVCEMSNIVYNVEALRGSEVTAMTLAVGRQLIEQSSNDAWRNSRALGPFSRSWTQLEEARQQVEQLLTELGLSPRPIQLFTTMYVSG